MVIVYESNTGFTRKYADMLAAKMNLRVFPVQEIAKAARDEEIIFLGWMKAGRIQGLNKVRKHKIIAVCGSGTAQVAEPSTETVVKRNKIQNLPFFYLRGGCFPIKELKGTSRLMLSMYLLFLKMRRKKDEKTAEAISIVENGFDGVKAENLEPLIEWLRARQERK